ncbi:TonB-dependent receptor plug domain-containing protein [Caulobacter sp. KR2-114]|uniref:TonB-dependent receptor plug domain-containing protein n=1 Tax=Caulobacter sp. KR2-114 TaxID=3400912 RepID=UPI003C0A5E94
MHIKTTRGRLLASSMIMGAAAVTLSAGVTTTASAAAATDTASNGNEVTEVVITGSRIKGNTESPSPISVSTQAEIQLTKAQSVEDVLSRMTGPDFSNGGLSSASNNGGVGLSEVGLRGLGPTRTLVLIDGQRLIPVFSGATSVPDLNSVPLAMVDRVEVLRDGASSIYGADAVGGVINIITKKHADGLFIDGSVGGAQHGGGTQYSVTGTLGLNSDKGNLLLGVGWDHTDAVQVRDWALNPHLNQPGEGGSTYRSQIDLLQDENSSAVWANGTQYDIHNPIVATLAPNLVYLPTVGKVKLNANAPGWNWLTGELDRKQISFNGHYNITDNITFVGEGFFTDRNSAQSLRPEPLLGDTIATVVNGNQVFAGFVVPTFAPGNTTGQDITAFLTPTQFGPRRYNQDSQTYRIRFGFEGTLAGKWDWELGYVDQENHTVTTVHNEGNFNHLAQITGQIQCIDVPGGCMPNNLPSSDPHSLAHGGPSMIPVSMPNFFNGPNMFTADQAKYLTFTNTDRNNASERYFYANISGPVFDLPAGTVKGAVGFEYRREHLDDTPDELVQEGWGPNQSNPTSGGYNVTSLYGELNVPVLKDAPFAKSLTLTPSVRYDHYSNFGDSTTGKFGVDWQVIDDVRVRGSYWTGFRAPSTAELFGGQLISDISASGDPCDTRTPANANGNANSGQGLTGAGSQCALALTGKTNNTIQFNSGALTQYFSPQNVTQNNQEQILIGGNPNLRPEIARGWGAGVVFTPHFVPGFSFDIDYYHTELSNTILTGGVAGVTSPDIVLLGCYGAAQNSAFCSLIHRNAAGTIYQIDSLNTNLGNAVVEGLDFEWIFDTGRQHWDIPSIGGSLRADLQLSYLITSTQSQADGTVANYPGTFVYANEGVYPRWKGVLNLDYKRNALTLHWDTRYIEHTVNVDGSAASVGNRTPDVWYNDISVSYNFAKLGPAKSARVTLGIDNLFDQDPPFLTSDSICKCNSLAGPYDFVGRFFYGRISTSF